MPIFGGLYRVFAIRIFLFDMEGVTLIGGPKNPGKDFLPVCSIQIGVEPQIGLLVGRRG